MIANRGSYSDCFQSFSGCTIEFLVPSESLKFGSLRASRGWCTDPCEVQFVASCLLSCQKLFTSELLIDCILVPDNLLHHVKERLDWKGKSRVWIRKPVESKGNLAEERNENYFLRQQTNIQETPLHPKDRHSCHTVTIKGRFKVMSKQLILLVLGLLLLVTGNLVPQAAGFLFYFYSQQIRMSITRSSLFQRVLLPL